MNMNRKPPTQIKVSEEQPWTLLPLLVAKLCELGYDVILDEKYLRDRPTSKFYHIYYCPSRVIGDYNFGIRFNKIVVWDDNYEAVLIDHDISDLDFIDYVLFLWGMSRGYRFPNLHKQIDVTKERIKQWKLRDLVSA